MSDIATPTQTIKDDITELLRLNTQSPNLFYVEIFGEDVKTSHEAASDKFSMPNPKFRCKGVTIGGVSLTTKKYALTKENYIDTITTADSVTFDWDESHDAFIWAYHQAWFKRFYDRERDVYVSGPEGKKRRARVVIFDMLSSPLHYLPVEAPIYVIEFIGLLPPKQIALSPVTYTGSVGALKKMEYSVDKIVVNPGSDYLITKYTDAKESSAWGQLSSTSDSLHL
jgi:hypothetical protein